jgi:hypothetical protein
MTKSMHASLTAIGRQLYADYLPTVAKPLPSELKHLVAQLVALEAGKRGSTERSREVLQSAIAQPRPAVTGFTD